MWHVFYQFSLSNYLISIIIMNAFSFNFKNVSLARKCAFLSTFWAFFFYLEYFNTSWYIRWAQNLHGTFNIEQESGKRSVIESCFRNLLHNWQRPGAISDDTHFVVVRTLPIYLRLVSTPFCVIYDDSRTTLLLMCSWQNRIISRTFQT